MHDTTEARARLPRARAAVLACVVVAAPVVARADVPPPAGYVDHCNVAEMQRPGEECFRRPKEWAFAREAPAYLTKMGYCQACRSFGATYAALVYCRPAGQPALPADWESSLPKDLVPPRGGNWPYIAECPRESPLVRRLAARRLAGIVAACVALLALLLALVGLWRARRKARRGGHDREAITLRTRPTRGRRPDEVP